MKPKYKISWHPGNMFSKSQEQVVMMQNKWKAFAASVIATTFVTTNTEYAFYGCLIAGAVDWLLTGFYFEEKSPYKGKL